MYFNTAPYDLKCFGGTGIWYGLSAKNEHVRNEDSDTPTYPLKIAFKSQIIHVGTSGLCFFVGLKRSSREEHDISLSMTHPCNSATHRSNGSTGLISHQPKLAARPWLKQLLTDPLSSLHGFRPPNLNQSTLC